MYREAGSVSVLSGVLSGPYAGGKRTLDAALLEKATRQRLERALSGRESPEPIASDRLGAFRAKINPSWGVIVGALAMLPLFALGFNDPASRFALQPPWFVAIYLGLGALFGLCLIPLLRRRALAGEGALRPGRYLFPLDAVEVTFPDAQGHQQVIVHPLGDARDASIETKGRSTDLVVRFADGELQRWALRGDPHGDVALRRLERAQHLLEELSYKKELAAAFANDVFFDIRVDASWAKYAPGASVVPVQAPTLMMVALGRYAPVVSLLVALGFGGGTFLVRGFTGDVALFNRALAAEEPEAFDRYVAIGGKRRAEAERLAQGMRDRSRWEREKDEAEAEAAKAREAAAAEMGRQPAKRAVTTDDCVTSLEDIATRKHPKTVSLLTGNLRGAMEMRDRVVLFDFQRHVDTGEGLEALVADENVLTGVFQRVLSDQCPTSILRFTTNRNDHYAARLLVDYKVERLGATWVQPGGTATVQRERFLFDVKLLDRDGTFVDGFTLALPPATTVPLELRERSIFAHHGKPPTAGPWVEVVATLQDMRAFDRLYDEVWSLFFDGDPRVPYEEQRSLLWE